MKIIRLFAAFLCVSVCAAELPEIHLWRNGAPGSEGKTQNLVVITNRNGERSIYQVHKPSITPYLPAKCEMPATAVIVIPGGGHRVLAYDHEGPFVAKALAARGIAAFVYAQDEIDRASSKPDFQALIYPGRSEQIQPTTNTPPAFLVCGYKDRPDISQGLAEVYLDSKPSKSRANCTSTAAPDTDLATAQIKTRRPMPGWRASMNG